MHSSYRPSRAALLLVAAGAASAACGRSDAAPPAPPPPEVVVHTVRPEALTLTMELPGRTVAVTVSEVRPQINGIIQRRLFTEGQEVAAGQVLYQIDPALYQAAYDSAKANLAQAEASLFSARLLAERYAELVKTEAVSRQQNDDAQAGYKQAEAQVAAARAALDTARINLEYTRITAPVAGRVSASVYTPGALVTAGQAAALTTVRQLDPIYVDITQSSEQLVDLQRQLASGRLRPAGKGKIAVQLRLEDGSLYEHAGTLAFTDAAVDETTGMVTLRTVFPNPRRVLMPGQYVHAVVPQGGRRGGPARAAAGRHARRRTAQATALVVTADGKVEARVLKTERTSRRPVGGQRGPPGRRSRDRRGRAEGAARRSRAHRRGEHGDPGHSGQDGVGGRALT